MFRFGISTACLYPDCVADSVEKICSLKPQVCEIFMNSVSEMDAGEINKIKEILKKNNTEVISLHPFSCIIEGLLFFSGYKKRVVDGLELYKRFFSAAASLGAKFFVFHGERDHTTYGQQMIDEDSAFEVYEKLCDAAINEGIMFTQENVAHFRSQSASFLLNLRKALDKKIGFTFDVKQAYRGNVDPFPILDAMGHRLLHFHINDFGTQTECCLLGKGDVNYEKIFQKLYEIGYCGDFILEVYKKNFEKLADLKENIDLFNKAHPFSKDFVLDRFEGNFAVVEDNKKRLFNVEKRLLPNNFKENTIITNTNGIFTLNNERTVIANKEIKQKVSKLFE